MEGEEEQFETLLALMPEGWKAKAKELGALVRARKVKTAEELLRVILLYLTAGKSFGGTSALLEMGDDITLKKVGVWKRVKHSAGWLRWLDENILRGAGLLAAKPGWLAGKEVRLVDGTEEPVSGNKRVSYLLHYCVSLYELDMKEMLLTNIKEEGEKLSHFKSFGKGQIEIGDRAYGTIGGMEYVLGCGADFVLRLRAKAFKMYNEKGRETNIMGSFRGLKRGESGEKTVFYKTREGYKPVRICAVRKDRESERAGLERIRKTNRRKQRGNEASRAQSEYNKYVIVATSLDESIQAGQVLELYRMRWQIELVFRRLKSLFHYNEIPVKLDESARAWFYGKLLLSALCETAVNKGRFSPSELQKGWEKQT
jgi:hypothetical protein